MMSSYVQKPAVLFLMVTGILIGCTAGTLEDDVEKTGLDITTFAAGKNNMPGNDIRSILEHQGKIYAAIYEQGLVVIENDSVQQRFTSTDLDGGRCIEAAGLESSILAFCYDSTMTLKKHYYNGSTWAVENACGNQLSETVILSGKLKQVYDLRSSGFLDQDTNSDDTDTDSQSSFCSYGNDGVAETVTNLALTTSTKKNIKIDNQAIVDILADSDSKIAALGYYWDHDATIADEHAHSSGSHPGIASRHLALYRFEADFSAMNLGTSGSFKPITFGTAFETPLAMTYINQSAGSDILEVFYVATDKRFYVVTVAFYNQLRSVTYYTTEDGLLSNDIRDMTASNGTVYMATDKGIATFKDSLGSITVTNSGLPSENIRSLLWHDNTLWAATDAGIARIQF